MKNTRSPAKRSCHPMKVHRPERQTAQALRTRRQRFAATGFFVALSSGWDRRGMT